MLKMNAKQLLLCVTLVTLIVSATPSDNANSVSGEFIPITGYNRKLLGGGVKPSDLLIGGCLSNDDDPPSTTCDIITREGSHCNITYFMNGLTVVESLHQLPSNKVLLHIRQTWDGRNKLMVEDHLTVVDMTSCVRVYNVSLPKQAVQVIPYEDGGYDVIVMDKKGINYDHLHLEHYDDSGKKFGDSPNVTFSWEDKYVQATSTKSRNRGIFIRGYSSFRGPTGVKFLVEGSEVKDVLELNSIFNIVSDVDSDKYYALCGRSIGNEKKVECARFDIRNDKVFKTQLDFGARYDGIKHLRVSDAGIVLFGKEDNKKLIVAEIHPDGQPIIQRFDLPWNGTVTDNCQVRDFDRVARSFTYACELKDPNPGIAFHKFNLTNKT